MFVLTRTNKQARKITSTFDDAGVSHSFFGRDAENQPWGDGLTLVYRGLEAIDKGQGLQHKPAGIRYAVLDRISESSDLGTLDNLNGMSSMSIVRQLDLYYPERKRLKGALKAAEWSHPERVKVGTIHSAKGLEAPCVYLFDSLPHTISGEKVNVRSGLLLIAPRAKRYLENTA